MGDETVVSRYQATNHPRATSQLDPRWTDLIQTAMINRALGGNRSIRQNPRLSVCRQDLYCGSPNSLFRRRIFPSSAASNLQFLLLSLQPPTLPPPRPPPPLLPPTHSFAAALASPVALDDNNEFILFLPSICLPCCFPCLLWSSLLLVPLVLRGPSVRSTLPR